MFEEGTPTNALGFAVYILTRVVPAMLSRTVFIGEREALARSWCFFLSNFGYLDREKCGGGMLEEDIEAVAKKLIEFVSTLVAQQLSYIVGEKQGIMNPNRL